MIRASFDIEPWKSAETDARIANHSTQTNSLWRGSEICQ